MKLGFITFYSDSFKSRAKVLLDSLEKYEPNSPVFAFEVDNPTQVGNYVSGLAKLRLEKMKEILEQNKDLDALMLLGADCEIFQPLNTVREMLKEYSCIITPHVTSPLPNDDKSPTMAQIYQTGHANADIFVITNYDSTVDRILNWLIEQDISDKKQQGIFYEQTWMSALPFIFPNVAIIRDNGYNVGYWNIMQRDLKDTVIAQYSGYVKGKPEIMTKYQTRYKPEDLSEEVLEFYKRYDGLITE